MSERAYSEYRDKVVETFGKKKEQKVRDEVAQDRVNRNPLSSSQVIVTGNGKTLFLDSWSGRYFESDVETIKKAQNDTNYQVMHHNYASLGDFWDRIGLAKTKESDEVGWSSNQLLEVDITSVALSEDGRPCIVLDFVVTPVRDYFRAH